VLTYEYINREWIVSGTARRVYRLAAAVSVVFFVGGWLRWLAMGFPQH